MVELAEQYDVMIIEDSPYFEIRFEGEFIPSIKSYDKSDRVIYLGSFSKTLCPGIRLGWVVASKAVIERYRVLKEATDFQAGTVAQSSATFLADFDLDQHLVTCRNVYRCAGRGLLLPQLSKRSPTMSVSPAQRVVTSSGWRRPASMPLKWLCTP